MLFVAPRVGSHRGVVPLAANAGFFSAIGMGSGSGKGFDGDDRIRSQRGQWVIRWGALIGIQAPRSSRSDHPTQGVQALSLIHI